MEIDNDSSSSSSSDYEQIGLKEQIEVKDKKEKKEKKEKKDKKEKNDKKEKEEKKEKPKYKGMWKNKPACRVLAATTQKRLTKVDHSFLLKNTGTGTWHKGTKLIRDWGFNYKGDEKMENVPNEWEIPSEGEIKPGDMTEVFVHTETPNKSGMFFAVWRVTSPEGVIITPRLRFRIKVE